MTKDSTNSRRIGKPRPDFPLFPHKTGRWAKKVRGKFVFFGSTLTDPKGEAALNLWLDQKDDLLAAVINHFTISLKMLKLSCNGPSYHNYKVDSMIFAHKSRTDVAPRRPTERLFKFLDRSARPEFEQVRKVLNTWIQRVPQHDRTEIARRLESNDDINLHSAVLELYTHELLLATDHEVQFHPEAFGSAKRPDFLAFSSSRKTETIFECTVVTEQSDEDRSSDARLNQLYEVVNRIKCPDFFLRLGLEGSINSVVNGVQWRRMLETWVESLDYESLLQLGPSPDIDSLPRLCLEHDGLCVTFTPIPKKPAARGKPGRVIGVQAFEGCVVTSRFEIQRKFKHKASKYGHLNCPYVIVLNCIGEHVDYEEIHKAFFGSDGLWAQAGEPQHTRVSGVLALIHLLPWTLTTQPFFFHNPHAVQPYTGQLTQLPQVWPHKVQEGRSTHDWLGIAPGWPFASTAEEI